MSRSGESERGSCEGAPFRSEGDTDASLSAAWSTRTAASGSSCASCRNSKADQDSALAKAARALEDCLEQALVFHANYLGVEAPSLTLNRDFEQQVLAAGQVAAYSAMVGDNWISLDTFWTMMK